MSNTTNFIVRVNRSVKPDYIVRVNRSVKPDYSNWFQKLEHPELECSGPTKYSLKTGVKQWIHNNQKWGAVQGNTIFKQLKKDNLLGLCLNLLQDGLAIQAKGIFVFRELFGGEAVFLWGLVGWNSGHLCVPYLYPNGDKVGISLRQLNSFWNSNNPALLFKYPPELQQLNIPPQQLSLLP